MKMYVGTSGFGYKEWKGKFYPEKIPPKDMLHFYAGRLNTVEINNTFYHMPVANVLATWAEQVPDNFIFALKAPQVITHIKRLRSVSSETGYLFKSLSILNRKLGPVLFQFPKSLRADRPLLAHFLDLIPRAALCAFEFRSPTWHEDGIPDLLREKGFSWCIEDADDQPVEDILSTAPWGYLRLRRSDYTDADLARWAEKILSQAWTQAFVFFKHEDDGVKGPELAMRFQELVASRFHEEKRETEILRKAG
jgi:uncharacterized protein YecE (DUF72 family)